MRISRIAICVTTALCAGQLDCLAQGTPRPPVVQAPPRSPEAQQKTFRLPEGFRIELVASEPDVVNPINVNFDAAGRLYVSQSIEYPIPVAPGETGRDAILRIDDTNGDGVPDRVARFAEGLNIPIGVAPVAGGVLGFSVPQLLFFPDSESGGGTRAMRFGGFGFNDTHGMISSLTPWIDGWIYGCHGFVNTSTVGGTDGQPITMVSGNTYRLRADGSRIEHFAHGQVNPFGLAFDPWGNVFTADCHTRPATMLLRGAHYPRSAGDGLGLGPELMTHSHGSTGIAGIVYYAASAFPKTYRGGLLIGNPITGRINFDRLERHGAGYRAIEQPDFLTCDDPWFRPVDMQLAADGSLYVADMYNAVIGHYEVPLTHPRRDRKHGRIWRIHYVGSQADSAAPRDELAGNFRTATAEQLVEALGSANLTARIHATSELVDRIGPPASEHVRGLLRRTANEFQRAHAVWILERLDGLRPDEWTRLLGDESALVRLHAVRVLGERKTWTDEARAALLSRLDDTEPFVVRAVVDALGRHPESSFIRPLLACLGRVNGEDDPFLLHKSRMALRDTLQSVDQIGELAAEFADDAEMRAQLIGVVVGVRSASAARFLWEQFEQGTVPPARLESVLRHVMRNAEENELPDFDALARRWDKRKDSEQIAVASALIQGAEERGMAVPKAIRDWGVRLVRPLLTSDNVGRIQQGIQRATQMRLRAVSPELARLARRQSPYAAARIPAAQALMSMNAKELVPTFFTFVGDEEEAPIVRQFSAEKLANRKSLHSRVLAMLPTVPHLIAVGFGRGLAIDPDGARSLLDLVEQGKVSPRVLQDAKIRQLVPVAGGPEASRRLKTLLADLPSANAIIQRVIDARRVAFTKANTDPGRGAKVFKKSCAVCHRLDNDGEKVGPELDGIGQRNVTRLLEDILDPNRTVDRNYHATIIATSEGQVFNGLVVGQEGQVVLLVDQMGKRHRIPTGEIEERRRISASPMPAEFHELFKPNELHDLIAFLLTKSVKKSNPDESD